jgi:hypothetical protein
LRPEGNWLQPVASWALAVDSSGAPFVGLIEGRYGADPDEPKEATMTQYLLSVYMVDGQEPPSAEEMERMYADVDALNEEIKRQGIWVFAGGLHPASTATVVREERGEVLLTDGPFPEAKEQLGGVWVIEAADLDAALAWARKATVACGAPVEVRPFQDEPEQ